MGEEERVVYYSLGPIYTSIAERRDAMYRGKTDWSRRLRPVHTSKRSPSKNRYVWFA